MRAAAGMNLVFRLGRLGFSLPVDDLAEIVEVSTLEPDFPAADPSRRLLGHLAWRQSPVELFELWTALGLPVPRLAQGEVNTLILGGKGGYWALAVDGVEGIFPQAAFEPLDIPPLLAGAPVLAFDRFLVWRGEPLHGCSALGLEAFREAA